MCLIMNKLWAKSNLKPKNKAKVSFITNKGVTQLNAEGTLQKDETLKPQMLHRF